MKKYILTLLAVLFTIPNIGYAQVFRISQMIPASTTPGIVVSNGIGTSTLSLLTGSNGCVVVGSSSVSTKFDCVATSTLQSINYWKLGNAFLFPATSTDYVLASFFTASSTTGTSTFPNLNTSNIGALSSAGFDFHSNNGTLVATWGAGGGANASIFGGTNIYGTVSGNNFTATSTTATSSFPNATTTNLYLAGNTKSFLATDSFGRVSATSTPVLNVTGSGNIASSGGTSPNITFTGTLPVANGGTGSTSWATNFVLLGNGTNPFLQVATSSLGIITSTPTGLTFTSGTGALSLTSGYVIPLIASTTEWATAYASTTALTPAYMRGLFSNTATGLTYNSATGATSLTAGYNIPLTASTTDWNNYFLIPSTRITAGTNLSWSGNTLNGMSTSSLAALNYWTLGNGFLYNATSSNMVGVGSTSPIATLSVQGSSTFPTRDLLDVASSSGTRYVTVTSRGNVGIASSTPSAPLSVAGTIVQDGNYVKLGNAAPLYSCNTGSPCVELWGNDNTTNGVQYGSGNASTGTSAFSDFFLMNDTGSVNNFAAIALNSSTYSDTTFGTGLAVANQLSLENTVGPVAIIAGTSTNGYINFLTNGTASTNEVMRITSGGLVGIGTTSPSARLAVTGLAGATDIFAIASSTNTRLVTVTASGTVGIGTISPGSQFQVNSSAAGTVGAIIKGASSQTANLTNWQNSSGTNLFSVSASGLLAITNTTTFGVQDTSTHTGGTTAIGFYSNFTGASDVTSQVTGFRSTLSTAAASYTVTNLRHFQATNATIGSGSAINSQYGVDIGALSGASNNYGIALAVPAASNSWNIYANGTAVNYMQGQLTIGNTATGPASNKLLIGTAAGGQLNDNLAGLYYRPTDTSGAIGMVEADFEINPQSASAANFYNFYAQSRTRSSVVGNLTGNLVGFYTDSLNSSATYSVANMAGFQTGSLTNSGGGITNYYGFRHASVTTATNNYGFYTSQVSGATNWAFYGAGTAQSYFGGNIGVGSTTPFATLSVKGAGTGTGINFQTTNSSNSPLFSILDNGNVGNGTTTPAAREVIVGTAGTADIFAIASSTAARLLTFTASGRLGVGSSTPISTMAVQGSSLYPTTDLFDVASSTGANVFAILASGRVGVSTSSPTSQFTVVGTSTFDGPINNLIDTGNTPSIIASTTVGFTGGSSAMTTQGRYAYLTNRSATNNFAVVDISNASTPILIATTSLSGAGGILGAVASGNYVYVTDRDNQKVEIVDVSTASSPTVVGTVTGIDPVAGGPVISPIVSGRYLYASGHGSANSLYVIDIASSSAPYIAGSVVVGTTTTGMVLRQKYIFFTERDQNALTVANVSNPSSPTVTSTTTLTASFNPSALVGSDESKYLFAFSNGTNKMEVINVANPAAPTVSLDTTIGSGAIISPVLSGRYIYAIQNSKDIIAIDVSSSTAPYLAGKYTGPAGQLIGGNIAISGRNLYVDNGYGLSVFDLNGIETQSLTAHSLEAGFANIINDLVVSGIATIHTGLNVGAQGIMTQGSLAGMGNGYIGGTFGVGTSSPVAKLSVTANPGTPTNRIFAVASSTNAVVFSVDGNAHVKAGGSAPTLSACGTSPSISGNDTHGTVTVGSVSASGCTITFAVPFTSAPDCTLTNQSMSVTNAMTYTVSTTALTVSQTGLTSAKLNYMCFGQ